MGGWSEDNVAANTLESAKAMVAQLRLDIDLTEAFVPGIRRGYVIVPYSTRTGETESQCQERLRGAMDHKDRGDCGSTSLRRQTAGNEQSSREKSSAQC